MHFGGTLCQARSLIEGRGGTTLLDALCAFHLGGIDVTSLHKVSQSDRAEEAKLFAASSVLSAEDMAQVESRRRRSTTSRWLDSTWAHRIAIRFQQGASKVER